jgi:uncharacterized Fe-S radical SAM superfamily protein PflX
MHCRDLSHMRNGYHLCVTKRTKIFKEMIEEGFGNIQAVSSEPSILFILVMASYEQLGRPIQIFQIKRLVVA